MKVLLKEFPKLLVSTDLMKVNRSISYMSFFLKDIFDYADAKGPDSTSLTVVRNAPIELERNELDLFKITKALEPHE